MGTINEAVGGWVQEAKDTAGWLVALGVLTAIAGVLAIASPLLSGLSAVVLIGVALAIGGVARTIGAFTARSFGQGTLAFIGGILTFWAGLILAARPGIGLASLTLMLGAYLLIDGISGAVLAFRVRPESGWGFMLFSALIGVILGFLLLREWPLSGAWAIGTLVGISILISGFCMILMGSAARSLAKRIS
jgi:uncharacterized membrane protein HdeD (DUF308 family)